MISLQKAILRTLAYADVFDYPLTFEEVWRFLIGQGVRRKTQDEIKKQLAKNSYLVSRITYHKGFYCLKGRQKIVSIRKKREKWSREKLKIAQQVARWLRVIPWVKMVAVTGALAMNNSDKDDDIDLLIVTAKDRLWLSRGFMVTILRFAGFYRRPDKIKNMICPNMLLDENHLVIPKKERDLFSAHEICQLKPIWDWDGAYRKFLKVNQWAKCFLPNWQPKANHESRITNNELQFFTICNSLFSLFEPLAYYFQLRYMQSRKTTEITDPGRIRFHPKDARGWVLKEYKKRLKKLGI